MAFGQSKNEHFPKGLVPNMNNLPPSKLNKGLEDSVNKIDFGDDTKFDDNERGAEYLTDFYEKGTL